MIKFDIFGASTGTISMLIEAMYSLYESNFCVRIIRNVAPQPGNPYEIEGIEIVQSDHTDWSHDTANKLIPGMYMPKVKRIVFDFFKENYGIDHQHYSNLIHAHTSIAQTASLGQGCFINPNVTLAPFCKLGNQVSVNRNASIGHHSFIDDYCSINPGAHIASSCKIGKGVVIGMGVNIFDGVEVGEGTIIGAGSLVTKDLPSNVKAFGSPARVKNKLSL